MATILPGSPPSFDRNDVAGTVKALCNYTRNLQENIDFLLGQLQKSVTAAQSSIEGLNTKTASLQTAVSSLGHNAAASTPACPLWSKRPHKGGNFKWQKRLT